MSTNDTRTFFVALPIEAELGDRLGAAPPGVSLLVPADRHLTIAFLGSVGEEAARAGFDALRLALAPRTISLGAIEPMGAPDRWSALSAQVDDPALAQAMTEARGAVWAAARARPDDRPARPHVTLARLGRRAGQIERDRALAWAHGVSLGVRASIDRVALYASRTGRAAGGPRYEVLASQPLSGRSAPLSG